MFLDFYYYLRKRELPVSPQEWLMLLEALDKGMSSASFSKFYFLCRSLLVKHESKYDLFDQCFTEFFEGVDGSGINGDLSSELLDWLETPVTRNEFTKEQIEMIEERLKEQKERHDGGSKWVGTGGTSPFGHSGHHPQGIRVGGNSQNRSAMQIATARKFRNLRKDIVLDTRDMGLALKKLRKLAKVSNLEEVDIDETIEATAKNAGEISIKFARKKKNTTKLLLLMDVGGSMTYHTQTCERLFSAAHGISHFKEFKTYYFHNCPYDFLWEDLTLEQRVSTDEVLRNIDESWYLLVVGDAAMSPYEITAVGGCIDYYQRNKEPGYIWLQRIRKKMPKAAWLNPENPDWWEIPSNQLVRRIFPEMFPLTLQGLEDAVDTLV